MKALDLSMFVGGQGETHVDGGLLSGGRTYRGDIKLIEVVSNDLHVVYDWLAVIRSLASGSGWEIDSDETKLDFHLSLRSPVPNSDQWGRIIINGESNFDPLVVLYPKGFAPNGQLRRLDRSQVRGGEAKSLLCTDPAEIARHMDTHVSDSLT